MTNKIIIGIGAAIALLIGVTCFLAWFLSGSDNRYYYVQIDNSKIEEVHSRGGVIDLSGEWTIPILCMLIMKTAKERILPLAHQEN